MGVRKQTYRLKLTESRKSPAREIEFEAAGADAALRMAQQFCSDGPVELYENGRKLAALRLSTAKGFWIVAESHA